MIRHNDLDLSYLESTPGGLAGEGDPLVVLIHGRGADATDLAPLADAIGGDRPIRFVLPDAPRRFEAAPGLELGYTWFDGYPPKPASLEPSRKRFTGFLDQVQRRYGVDDSRLLLCGFSQGALIALDAGLRREEEVAGVIALSGGIDKANLPPEAIRSRPDILMIHGTRDAAIPLSLARSTRALLEKAELDPEYHELRIGHEITNEAVELIEDFVTRRFAID
ncbi:MAG: alpha/beta fold hydrolase [Thermoanaerobaculia bacterium]|nr:alpha/beta fold hydrolase [Thermoanaerobaculia bacterium]